MSSEFKGTPGSWEHSGTVVDHLGNTAITETFSGHRCCVAFMSDDGIGDDEMEANANLIAAAPDLLAALQQALMWIEADETAHGRPYGTGNVCRDAIAKALGEPIANRENEEE